MRTRRSARRPAASALIASLSIATVAIATLFGAAPASAATIAAWAGFAPLTGTAGDFETELTFGTAPGLTAEVTSTSRGGQVGVISGATNWLAEGTPIGAVYGSSREEPYLNLRPRADSAVAPSVTTYSFEAPTPSSGWAFALGDIDADAVRVSAVTAAGTAATAAELGYRDSFNYCAPGVIGKPSCTGDPADVPTWDPTTATLTGNAAAADTSGAAAWFEPNVPLVTLTFTFTRRAGFPVYQTWFASLGRDIGGTVTEPDGAPVGNAALTLIDENGTVVGATTSAADGSYVFPGFTAADGYTVSLLRPDGRIVVGPDARPADIALTDDLDVDFVVRDIVPVPVSGSVLDVDGLPIAGVEVTLTGDGGSQTTTTDALGSYLFDTVAPGDYDVTIPELPGYDLVGSPDAVTVPEDSETLITDVDFVLAPLPSLGGTVTVAGEPVAGVTVTAVGPGGTLTTSTRAGGSYVFPGLSVGEYVVTAVGPDGTTAVGAVTRTESIDGTDVTGVDFAFARTGVVAGIVLDTDGAPVVGAVVTITSPAGTVPLTTDADGGFALADLPPGTYDIELVVPDGYSAVSALTRTVTITAAGEGFLDEGFLLDADDILTPEPGPAPEEPEPSAAPAPAPAPGAGDDDLAVTGATAAVPLVAFGTATLLLGGVAVLIATRRRRQR